MNNNRVLIVIILITAAFIGISVKLFSIQVMRNEELKYMAKRQQTKTEVIKAERGLIYDRNNILLAYNRNDVSFYVDLRMAKQSAINKIANKFSEIFGKPAKYYLNLMKEKGKNICLEKKAPGEKAYLLKDFKAVGLFTEQEPTRMYPYNNLASHLLGYVSSENKGVIGIESTFEDILDGTDGAMVVERNAIGDMMTVEEELTKPSEPGENLVLTLNKSYQSILEEELDKGLDEFGGSYAIGIIMDPNTGEILALSNKKDYDPNLFWKYTDTVRRNKAFTDTYEPGSTFKGITMAALLDQKLCSENDVVNVDNGKWKFNGAMINDSHQGPSSLTVKGVIEQSSNVGMAKLVQKIDNDTYFKYLRGFGFGNLTSLGLPGEESGYLKKPNNWNNLTKAFMSFGYELSVTPLQLIAAYSAIINGGTLYQPQIIKRRLSKSGILLQENAPIQVRNVISKETSMKMREFLRGVVENGTAKNARLDMISVGGKTGTSQKLIKGRYSKSNYNSSFIGFFPVEDPKLICLVVVNSPEKGKYGGLVAAPIFRNVAERIVNSDVGYFRSIKKDQHDTQDEKISNRENNSTDRLNVINALNKVKTLNTSEVHDGQMPDLTDYQVKDALKITGKLGIKMKIEGSGIIVSQSVPVGQRVKKGTLCKVVCRNSGTKGTVFN